LRDAGLKCVQDGADVICLGSTTMHQSHAYLTENLPVPVINPGPLTYKLAETMLSLGLTQSRHAYPRPNVEKRAMIEAMAQAAADSEKAPA
jgi:allantoin racemase